jgi:hypothetical protein
MGMLDPYFPTARRPARRSLTRRKARVHDAIPTVCPVRDIIASEHSELSHAALGRPAPITARYTGHGLPGEGTREIFRRGNLPIVSFPSLFFLPLLPWHARARTQHTRSLLKGPPLPLQGITPNSPVSPSHALPSLPSSLDSHQYSCFWKCSSNVHRKTGCPSLCTQGTARRCI